MTAPVRAHGCWLRFALTAASAVAYSLALAAGRLHGLAWIAFVPFLLAVRRSSVREAIAHGWLLGVLGTSLSCEWLPRAVSSYFAQPLWLGVTLLVGMASVMIAPWVMLFAVWLRSTWTKTGKAPVLLGGAAWTAVELARSNALGGNPWLLFGYSQAEVLPVIQIAEITGVYGVSFAIAAVNCAVAGLIADRLDAGRFTARAAVGPALAAAVVALVAAFGVVRLRTFEPAGSAGSRVAIVQGNLDLGSQWREEFYGRNLEAYLRLTRFVLRDRPAVVFWPENAMSFFLEEEAAHRGAIASVLAASGAQLVAGGPHAKESDRTRYFNSAFVVSPSGTVNGRYEKRLLLPFAEHFPFGTIELLRREFGRVREFTPGTPAPPLATAAGRAGVAICNEAFYPEPAIEHVANGAEYLAVLSNDTWLGDRKFAAQAFATAVLRAVEQRRYVVRASTSGPSGIIDPFGRVQARTAYDVEDTASGTIRPLTTRTFYSRAGDLFALLCAAVALGTAAASRRRTPGGA